MRIRYMVAACAGVLFATSPARAENAPLDEIKGSEQNTAGVNVTVMTGGCTKKEDFQVSTHPGTSGVMDIEFKRLHADRCKGNFPDGIKIQFTWGDLKLPEGTKLAIKNPVEGKKARPSKRAETKAAPEKQAASNPLKKTVVAGMTGSAAKSVKPRKKAAKRCLRSKYRKHGCVKARARHHAHRTKSSMRRAARRHRAYHHRPREVQHECPFD